MMNSPDVSGMLAVDAHSVDRLRRLAQQDPQQALQGAARQFEALFIQMLLKSMRDATPQDGMFDSEQTRFYTAMLDQQMAQSLSAKGIGLADVMLRQLSRAVMAEPQPPSAPPALPADSAAPLQSSQSRDFMQALWPHAQAASQATGVPAHFILAQAALESGWGRHEIHRADGSPSFNLFGIKAGRGWSGPVAEALTTEYVNGMERRSLEQFRAYGSYAQGFRDYAELLRNNPRYRAVLQQQDAAGFAHGLQQAGYASDPRYADKLLQILQGSALRQIGRIDA